MSTPTLERLPTETLIEICSYLDPVGLKALSTSSKRCRAGAIPLLFRTLRVRTSGLPGLQYNVEALLEIFADPSMSRHVRRLELLSTFAPGRWKRWQYWPDDVAPATAQSYNGWWLLFAEMLALLTGLTDFVFASSMQIAPCVLDALSQKSVRLHMDTFQLRSLLEKPQDPISVDPFELQVATCANLHSLALRFDKVESSGSHNFNEEAVRDMIMGAAPNLKEVSILREHAGSSPWLLQAWRQPRTAWQGLELGRNPINTFGRLTLLELAGPNTADLRSIVAWTKITDFSRLKTLKLLSSVKAETIRWLSANTQMTSLRDLALDLCSLAPGDPLDPGHDALQTATALFLRTLPPLRSVRLTGDLSEYIIKETCRQHGNTLRQLLIPGDNRTGEDEEFIFTQHLLEEIAQNCPQLEEISVSLTRTHGDKKEIALYQCLGSMPKLWDIQLSLHCYKRASHLGIERLSDWQRERFHSRDGEGDVLNLDVRRLLINYAIDSGLAGSIFRMISTSKPAGSCPLERLEMLMPEISHSLNNSSFDSVVWDAVSCVARQWKCRANPRDDALHECTTVEIDGEDREAIEEEYGEAEFHEDVMEVWRSIWPAIEGKKNNWKSLPLEKI